MKLDLPGSPHLTYCLNVHPGETWDECVSAICDYALPVRDMVCPSQPFGLGLRISHDAAEALQDPVAVDTFRGLLETHELYAFTVNAFPYGTFHGRRVKDGAYHPDWRTRERVEYTRKVADFLAAILPPDITGSISTVPLSYKPWRVSDEERDLMVRHLVEVAEHLERTSDATGREIRLALEPEPDCLLETTDDVMDFFERLPTDGTGDCLRRWVGICFDTCHLSVQFEDLSESLGRMRSAGIRIPKVQLSSAVRAGDGEASRRELQRFCDPVYLHQVRCRAADGTVRAYCDLEDALQTVPPGDDEWRVHCHVPLYYEGQAPLLSTSGDLTPGFFQALLTADVEHWEIETYTFDVLPEELQSRGILASVCEEFGWVAGNVDLSLP